MRFILFSSLVSTIVWIYLPEISFQRFNVTRKSAASEDCNVTSLQRNDSEGSGEQSDVQQPHHCSPLKLCYTNDDCHHGQCIGAFVGKCNCNGCIDLWRCDKDSMCGGLKGSCNLETASCDCTMGYKKAGFSSFSDALINFCNVKNCTHQTEVDDCFGLQCTAGICLCLTE